MPYKVDFLGCHAASDLVRQEVHTNLVPKEGKYEINPQESTDFVH